MPDVLAMSNLAQSSSQSSLGRAALPSRNRYFRYFHFPYAHAWAVAMRTGGPVRSS